MKKVAVVVGLALTALGIFLFGRTDDAGGRWFAFDFQLENAAKAAIGRQMKDPESVKLRGVSVRWLHGVAAVCGEFDAKNSFGGYTGYTEFVRLGTTLFLEEEVSFRQWMDARGKC